MGCVDGGATARHVSAARRNNPLSGAGRLLVFGFILAVSFGTALAFTLVFGAWLMLPLAARLITSAVAIGGDKLNAEVLDGGCIIRFEFNRHGARVEWAGDGSRLVPRSLGREVETGRHRNEKQRFAMGRELKLGLRGIRRLSPDVMNGFTHR